jgi:hypothetical protein
MLAARLFATGLLLASSASALAEVHYVDLNSPNATPPDTNRAITFTDTNATGAGPGFYRLGMSVVNLESLRG